MSTTVWGALLGGAAGARPGARRCCGSPCLRRPQLAVRVLPYVRDVPVPSTRLAALRPVSLVADLGRGGDLRPGPALGGRRGRAGARRQHLRTPSARARRARPHRAGLPHRAGRVGAGRLRRGRRPQPPASARRRRWCRLRRGLLRARPRLRRLPARQPAQHPGQEPRTTGPRRVPDHRRAARAVRRGGGEPGLRARPRRTPQPRRALRRPRPGARPGAHRASRSARRSSRWPRSTGLPIVARFATGITVAMERGTPLADVLHAQAADVREAGRRLPHRDRRPQGDRDDGAGRVLRAAR